jgi:excinuclease ABC subunit C
MTDTSSHIETGTQIIKGYVKNLPQTPGVYRMFNNVGHLLYVGKARDLKRRVSSYTHISKLSNRLQRMVAETNTMEFVTTHTEVEALLLEANFIKEQNPRYNILMKDGKSFVFIEIQGEHPYPKIGKYRGAQKEKNMYFGPFASVDAVNDTLIAIHKTFKLRSCSDTIFATRTRPCLQYHIKRCSAPCVGRVSPDDYKNNLEQAKEVLNGKTSSIQKELASKMQRASDQKEYEHAAQYRDQIKSLSLIQSKQTINLAGMRDADVLAIHKTGGKSCVQTFFFRNGSNYGSYAYFPSHDASDTEDMILSAFMMQFYQGRKAPPHVLTNIDLAERQLISDALSSTVTHPKRGMKATLIKSAESNAQQALARKFATGDAQLKLLKGVQETFGLIRTPRRIEVYDNSHISGDKMVGGMIVAGLEGFDKKAYRTFNIKTAKASDDYGMMREVLSRRFKHTLAMETDQHHLPDLVIIDGGIGQLNVTLETMADMGVGDIPVVSISKGPARKAGEERFHTSDQRDFTLPKDDPVFYYIQRLRDEAHRFAIGRHRHRRVKSLRKSLLDDIPNIGPKRKKALLQHFGSAVAVTRAGLADLQAVEGISLAMAEKIYAFFHGQK